MTWILHIFFITNYNFIKNIVKMRKYKAMFGKKTKVVC